MGRPCLVLSVGLAGVLAASPALAAPVALDLPARSYAESLIDIGVRSRLSMLNVAACRGEARPLRGRYEPRDAIARLLKDAPCRFEFLDAATVRFEARPVPQKSFARAALVRQDRPSVEAASQLDAVIVTAQKRSELLLDSPSASSVIGAARLNDTSAFDVGDVAAQLAAVVLTNLGPGRDKLLLRGVSDGGFTGRTRSTVATYLDDAPITYNAPDPDLVLFDVDRVEILRGPQGALYGGGSIGGVYRIISKAPDLARFGGEVQLRGASTDAGARSGAAAVMINAPLAPDQLGLRASVYDVNDAGYLQNDALRQSNVDRTARQGGRAALTARWDGWTATVSGAAQRLATADTQYTTGVGLRRANLVREAHKNDFAEAGLTVTGPAGPLTVHSATSYVHHTFASRYDASAALSLFDEPNTELGVYDEASASEIIAQDLYVTTPNGGRLTALGGVFASHLSVDTPSSLASRPVGSTTPTPLFTEDRRDRVDELAIYGDLNLRLTDQWSLAAGARLFRTDVGLNAVTMLPRQPAPPRTLSRSEVENGISPKLSLQYRWTAHTNLYALISAGQRAGGFNTGGLRPPTPAQSRYSPDRLVNYEAGIKTQFLDGHGEASASFFHDRWRAIQTDQFASGLPLTTNVGDGRLTGLEADAAFHFGGFRLEANTLLTQSRLSEVTAAFSRDAGRSLPGAPSVAFAALSEYRRPLTSRIDLLLGGRASYTGRAPLTFDPTPVNATSAAYIDAQLWAQLLTRRYRVALNITNPSNAHADTFAYGNPFSFGQVRQSTPQRPRTVELVLSAAF